MQNKHNFFLRGSQKGGGSAIWEIFPNIPVFFLGAHTKSLQPDGTHPTYLNIWNAIWCVMMKENFGGNHIAQFSEIAQILM